MGTLVFLICINDLPYNLQSSTKLFADDTSLVSTVYDPNISNSKLDSNLKKTPRWTYKWKMTFNPDLSKQAQEVTFSRKAVKISHLFITFTMPVTRTTCQKNLGFKYDEKLSFYDDINV